MDLAPYVAPAVTAFLAAGGTYMAVVTKLARLEVRIEHVERAQVDTHELSRQIAAIGAKVDDLREDVRKHNGIVERTVTLEQSTKAAWHQIDAMRDDIHDIKVGGSS